MTTRGNDLNWKCNLLNNPIIIRLIYKLEGWDYEDSYSDSDYEPSDTDDTDDETDDDTVSEDVSFLGCNVVIM